jgi:hypothetical protein
MCEPRTCSIERQTNTLKPCIMAVRAFVTQSDLENQLSPITKRSEMREPPLTLYRSVADSINSLQLQSPPLLGPAIIPCLYCRRSAGARDESYSVGCASPGHI